MNEQRWRKSTRSQNEGACIELSATLDRIRDSKNLTGPTLRVDVAEFVRAVKLGLFDR
ncbi:DUF397 domain-containing protein [Gandjariella thermophila]|uniref:DUF397 domain-containing protein n=1 Tax=Gandjariella thermophila TaxID=1931992 RepID=A0A4D4JD68_9PSEU|nr:DUF397 domain-containing protein [Gandjariella thermophila]GDY33342.1 hypothetical protein GTS_49750 [Gandjariella thermophila]